MDRQAELLIFEMRREYEQKLTLKEDIVTKRVEKETGEYCSNLLYAQKGDFIEEKAQAVSEAKREERERILKLYEDMGCVPEEDNCWYSFWQALKGER